MNSPFEGFYTYLRVALFGGVAIASPVIMFQLWQFVAPGLYNSERRVVIPLAFTSTVLFFSGAAFCYYAIFPYAFPFFLSVLDLEASLSVSGYLSAVIKMMGAFGLCFQLPVITWFAARMGLIDHRDLIDSFRYAVVGIFVIAAVITPPAPLTQSLLAGPLIILYIISIGVARLATTKV
ncbi:MAG: twin-arginine translocase subunit TatC, partial [Rhodobacterales bacterium]|nr:twin-arginine translocase subunit TatC [Rhodobacterales bacterium]